MLFKDGDAKTVLNSLILATVSTVLRHDPRHDCAYSLVRFKTGGENLAVWIISQRMMPPIAIVFPIFLLYVLFGWVDTYLRPDPALHRLQPALRDLDDARLHRGHSA